MTDLPTTGLPEAEGGGGKVDLNEVRGLLDRAQAALSDPRLSDEWKHAIQLAVDSLSTTLTSAVGAIGVGAETPGGDDSGGVPAVVSHGFQTEVSEAMKPGVEVFGRRFPEVWNPNKYEGQTYQPVSDYAQFILDSDRRNTCVYVRSDTLLSEISALCQVFKQYGTKDVHGFYDPFTFEFDEHGQHFEAYVTRGRDTQELCIRLAAQFPDDGRRYYLDIMLHEAQWHDPSVAQRVIPGYKKGKYCVLQCALGRLPLEESASLQFKDSSYVSTSDNGFRNKMALFAPVSLDLIFRLIREHAESEKK